jgi:S-disulfanyl-L-cysteine oxidoreductase SoxD
MPNAEGRMTKKIHACLPYGIRHVSFGIWHSAFVIFLVSAVAAQSTSRSVWDGVYTEAQAKRGSTVYHQHCASCHGPLLEGGETAGPLVGPIFLSNWNGVSVGDMFERTRMSMPQDKPGTISRQNMADVLAFVFSENKMPTGKTELARQSEMLKQIRFEAVKPAKK